MLFCPFLNNARYGEHWGEGAARCFSLEADILDEDRWSEWAVATDRACSEDHAVRLMPVPDSFVGRFNHFALLLQGKPVTAQVCPISAAIMAARLCFCL